ncbi:MAG: hypothetical protein H7Y60_12525 [Rhodospirillaceae bacterium]|nr:hypothetical protein [Rhodospirillales bacterium]
MDVKERIQSGCGEKPDKAPLVGGVAATPYNGTFTVVNGTGSAISNVTVKHTCGGFTDTVVAETLAPAQATKEQILRAQTGSNDYWTVSFQMGGQTKTRTNKQCNYEQSDAPGTCVITLYAENFSVLIPNTASCLNNHY